VEAVQTDDDRIGFEQLEQLRRERALSGTWSAGDAEEESVSPVRQAADLLGESFALRQLGPRS
jgi:hypothetical protein